jgi:exosortase
MTRMSDAHVLAPAEAAPAEPAQRRGARLLADPPFWLPSIVGLLVLAIPALIEMAQQTWSTEAGTHAPIVLATGLWLLHYNGLRFANARRGAGTSAYGTVALVLGLLAYIFGRAYGFLFIEGGGLYVVLLALFYRLFGVGELRRQAFPLFYLAFVIPLPGWLTHPITGPLQNVVSWASSNIMSAAGYPIARQGVALFVGPYQLLVEDACSGLNSLIGLIAISLFYIYIIHRQSWRYALTLVLFIIPIAIVVNIIRVTLIMLICYHLGDAAAQGIMHATTGMVLFILALGLVFLVDKLLSARVRRPVGARPAQV